MNPETPTRDLAPLEARLLRLERFNRLLLTLLFAVVGAFALGAKRRTDPPDVNADVVSARTFHLVDDKNNILALLGNNKGRAVLSFNSQHSGYAPVLIQETEEGASISLYATDKSSISLSTRPAPTGSFMQMTGISEGKVSSNWVLRNGPKASLEVKSSGGELLKLSEGALNLYGAKLDLRDAKGTLLQELPDKTKR